MFWTCTNLPLQAAGVEGRPAGCGVVLGAEHIQTRYPGGLGGLLGELVWRVGHQRDPVKELLHGERDGEEVLDEAGLLLEGRWGLRRVFHRAIFGESRWHLGRGGRGGRSVASPNGWVGG